MTHAQPASRIVQRVTSCRDCPKSRYEGRNAYRCAAAHRKFDDEDLPEAIPDWCPLESEAQPERKPMNADAIYQLAQRSAVNDGLTAIVRAVEAFHNIKDKP